VVTITERAAIEIKNILKQENKQGYGLRIFIAGAGCNGPQYGLALDEKPGERDRVFESNGVKIFFDERLVGYLEDSELDYVETPYGKGFIVHNPNASCNSECSSCH
jgi:iron-sulfur cluster insertion protein